jgi:acetoin utilization protein AcuB
VRRFPVVDGRGHLVGIVAERDLLNASPSEATTLSVWEIGYLLSKITVERVMTHHVITVTEDTPHEEAARIMSDNHVGGLPVTHDDQVVGMITETTLFRIFLEMLGARESGVRVTALFTNIPGKLHEITGAIHAAGGNIIALGTFLGESTTNATMTIKVNGIDLQTIKKIVEPLAERIIDIREMKVG